VPQPIPNNASLFWGMLGHMLSSFTYTSVACAIGPIVNPLQNGMNSTYEQYFARYLVWPMPFAQSVNRVFLINSSLYLLFLKSMKKLLKIQHLPYLMLTQV
jgi:hypothetical protein